MNKAENNLLTNSEVVFIIFGSMVGVGILALPASAAATAHEDGWITAIIGSVYPLYLIGICAYFAKKFPNDNILVISQKCFGRILGTILNFILLTFFVFLCASIATNYTNIIRTFIQGFLPSYILIALIFFVCAYTSTKGLKTIGKVSVVIFFTTVIIYFSPIGALKSASLLNVRPVIKSNIKDIFQGSLKTMFSYSGIETIFFIYPCVKDKKKFIKSSLMGLFIAVIVYTWVIFISIYYLGADIAEKNYWPFLLVTESVTVSIVNNFRYIFMFLWTLTVFKIVSNNYFISKVIMQDLFKKVNFKVLCYGMVPIFIYGSLRLDGFVESGLIEEKLTNYYVIFILIFITILALITLIKEGWKR